MREAQMASQAQHWVLSQPFSHGNNPTRNIPSSSSAEYHEPESHLQTLYLIIVVDNQGPLFLGRPQTLRLHFYLTFAST